MDDKMHSFFAVVIIVSLFSIGLGSYSRDSGDGCTQTRRGCKIESGQCVCGVGCYYEYRYNSKSECYKAIKSREADLCQRNPCKNGGTCSQTSQEPGFKCRCEGTGFYGQRCQYASTCIGTVRRKWPTGCQWQPPQSCEKNKLFVEWFDPCRCLGSELRPLTVKTSQ